MARAVTVVYSIDTSSLIEANRHYARDVFVGLWNGLEQLVANGRLLAARDVLDELKAQDDAVARWAKGLTDFFEELDEELQAQVDYIVNSYEGYKRRAKLQPLDADPFVVALARKRGATVVTQERRGGYPALKIPNICDSLNVPCLDLLGLARKEGWRF